MVAGTHTSTSRRISRAELLRGNLLRRGSSSVSSPFRPPWAVSETEFLDLCSCCDACLKACPTGLLVKSADGTPTVSFKSAECTFCGDCVSSCETGALARPALADADAADAAPWDLAVQISSACLSSQGITCRVCGDRCDARAITFQLALKGRALAVLDDDLCTGCGACVAPCPVDAITIHHSQLNETGGPA